ncbi:hypothetical protein DFH08DRAFT_196106 [Mycena albidolilacea]|uniref:Uncharacterized protein n=1 Tax=Mycena albidolilacea TaxID=1033008 RepID=A0AAD6ZZK8_9AGAR|nr:hypothetical protein DFH08DRAFT_196106 [Mycena albidolilacea]
MRKTSYAITALAVICTTVFTILSLTRTDWVVARYDVNALSYEGKYGLSKVCQRVVLDLPGGGTRFERANCRKFPTRDQDDCDENRYFCAAWSSAGYAVELAIGFGALSLVAILVGVSTAARRRRVWRAVAGFIIFHSVAQLVAFILIVDLYRTARYPTFEDAKLGPALIFNAVAWIFGVITAVTVIITGTEADRGKRWAAGNRPAHSRLDEATSLLRGN